MEKIDIAAIERQARALRAQEMQRLQGIFAERLRLVALLFGHSLVSGLSAAGEFLRPLFSWNPQDRQDSAVSITLAARGNRLLRRLFAWNPQHRRSC